MFLKVPKNKSFDNLLMKDLQVEAEEAYPRTSEKTDGTWTEHSLELHFLKIHSRGGGSYRVIQMVFI